MHIDITNSFIDRPMTSIEISVIEKIIATYIKTLDRTESIGQEYRVNAEWLPIYEKYLKETISSLQSKDIEKISRSYGNFFRHECSTGLHGMHFDMVETYMNPIRSPSAEDLQAYMGACKLSAELLMLNQPGLDFARLCKPDVGNPYGYEVVSDEGMRYFLSPGSEYHYCYAQILGNLIPRVKSGVVLELGGGFGGMAYYLIRDTHYKYIGLDLAENIALQTFYLSAYFPEKKFLFFDDPEFDRRLLDKDFDIALLPNFCIEHIPSESVDIAYNSYSLAEMTMTSITNYLHHIARITTTYFYHVNHTVWRISADDFVFDPKKFKLLVRFPTMWGRDRKSPYIDHHDFLYVRA